MKFPGIWRPTAERKLADIWLNAADRQSVTAGAYAIEQELKDDPEQKGESREKNRRVNFEKAVGIGLRRESEGHESHRAYRLDLLRTIP